MDRALSVEEKIKRAEEIYARRHSGENINRTTVRDNNSSNKKDIKLLKKMIIQIFICILIYLVIYIVQNSQFIFSEEFLNKVNQILSHDMNFDEIYNNCSNYIMQIINKKDTKNEDNNAENTNNENINNENTNNELAIGGANEDKTEETNLGDTQQKEENLSQEEKDINAIKQTTSFIKPVEGTITSPFGNRNPTTATVPTNHTGIDLAANLGTKIKSATEGEVVLSSEEGDYGKHLKIQIGEVSIIYAHCNQLYIKQGEKVTQGQEIAEVGSTGNSTGPHLHFEIRYQERTVDPQKILDL